MGVSMKKNGGSTGKKIRALLSICLMIMIFALPSCRRQEGVSTGHSDNIEGFLFVFDTRVTTSALVQDMRNGVLPTSIRITNVWDEVTEITDEQTIRDIYYYMSDLIVVGQTTLRREDAAFDVTYCLRDGSEANFHFETKAYLRLSDQNYMIETDGNLWRLLGQ